MRISADGEVVGRTPATFDLIAGAIKVVVPPAYLESRKEEIHVAQG
jgi:diacylglycerol kinase family enzyme